MEGGGSYGRGRNGMQIDLEDIEESINFRNQ